MSTTYLSRDGAWIGEWIKLSCVSRAEGEKQVAPRDGDGWYLRVRGLPRMQLESYAAWDAEIERYFDLAEVEAAPGGRMAAGERGREAGNGASPGTADEGGVMAEKDTPQSGRGSGRRSGASGNGGRQGGTDNADVQPNPPANEPEKERLPEVEFDLGAYALTYHKPVVTLASGEKAECPHSRWGHESVKSALTCARKLAADNKAQLNPTHEAEVKKAA